MAKAIDIGTSFIVGAEIKDGKEVFTSERDAFFSMPKEDFAEAPTDRATVFWIGDNDDHAHQLREWVGPCRPRLMHKFTSWDWVQQSGIAGPIWLRVNGRETRVPLLSSVSGEADRPAAASQVLSGGQRT